jgi:hypothetical protein
MPSIQSQRSNGSPVYYSFPTKLAFLMAIAFPLLARPENNLLYVLISSSDHFSAMWPAAAECPTLVKVDYTGLVLYLLNSQLIPSLILMLVTTRVAVAHIGTHGKSFSRKMTSNKNHL